MSVPFVSVVLTTYNRAAMVGEAIESALAQDHPRFEVIVVDDGSTDDTREVVARYGGVRYVRQENAGVAVARNTGTSRARGEWIAFLDDDDAFLPGYLSSQCAFAARHPDADMVISDARLVGGGRYDGSLLSARPRWRPPITMEALFSAGWATPSATFVRAEAARALPFDPEMWAEDTDFFFRFRIEGRKGVFNREALILHRRHAGDRGQAQRVSDRAAHRRAGLALIEKYREHSPWPRRTERTLHLARAWLHSERGDWRAARPHLWAAWRLKPHSLRVLRLLLRSLFA